MFKTVKPFCDQNLNICKCHSYLGANCPFYWNFNSPHSCLQDTLSTIYSYLIKNGKEENKMEKTRHHYALFLKKKIKEYTQEFFLQWSYLHFTSYFLCQESLDLQYSCTASPLPTANCAVLHYFYHLHLQRQEWHQQVNFHFTARSELHPTKVWKLSESTH